MKLKKRILACIVASLMIFNVISVSAWSVYAEETEALPEQIGMDNSFEDFDEIPEQNPDFEDTYWIERALSYI